MSRDDQQFPLRMPDGVRGRLKDLAARNRRSMNAEAVLAIESWLAERETAGKGLTPPPLNETAAFPGG